MAECYYFIYTHMKKARPRREIHFNGMNSLINGYKSHEMGLPCFPVRVILLYTYVRFSVYMCLNKLHAMNEY